MTRLVASTSYCVVAIAAFLRVSVAMAVETAFFSSWLVPAECPNPVCGTLSFMDSGVAARIGTTSGSDARPNPGADLIINYGVAPVFLVGAVDGAPLSAVSSGGLTGVSGAVVASALSHEETFARLSFLRRQRP